MENVIESVIFGLDILMFFLSTRQFFKYSSAVTKLQNVTYVEMNNNVVNTLEEGSGSKLKYVAVQGIVNAIHHPLQSASNLKVTGVIQLLHLREHIREWSGDGFWTGRSNILQSILNVIPFHINNNGFEIEVIDPISANVLELETIADVFTPEMMVPFNPFLFGTFLGYHHRGFQLTEHMLRSGSVITGVGELVSRNGKLMLMPPTDGSPYCITSASLNGVIDNFFYHKLSYLFLMVFFGVAGIAIFSMIYNKNRESSGDRSKRKVYKTPLRRHV